MSSRRDISVAFLLRAKRAIAFSLRAPGKVTRQRAYINFTGGRGRVSLRSYIWKPQSHATLAWAGCLVCCARSDIVYTAATLGKFPRRDNTLHLWSKCAENKEMRWDFGILPKELFLMIIIVITHIRMSIEIRLIFCIELKLCLLPIYWTTICEKFW